MEFTALESFYSEELQSRYVAGLGYTARPEDQKLRELLPEWVKQGRAVIGRTSQARVSGGN